MRLRVGEIELGGSRMKFYWYDASNASCPVFHRYLQDCPRVYFGDVYRKQGVGQVESRIYHPTGDVFKLHKSVAAAKAYVEEETKRCQ